MPGRKPARAGDASTSVRILDVAERLVQTRGFNGFSYADVAADLGMTKAALHYHFAGKAELGVALVERYAERFSLALDAIDSAGSEVPQKLESYADLYLGVLQDDRMCLCGMLAAEYRTLPEPMQERLRQFFDDNEQWLTRVLEEGRAAGTIELQGTPRETARMVVGSLEGAMLLARRPEPVSVDGPPSDRQCCRVFRRSLLS
jgi:TetR/AcrR family transcriptional regulator, transcriptional repressor for nem operon